MEDLHTGMHADAQLDRVLRAVSHAEPTDSYEGFHGHFGQFHRMTFPVVNGQTTDHLFIYQLSRRRIVLLQNFLFFLPSTSHQSSRLYTRRILQWFRPEELCNNRTGSITI